MSEFLGIHHASVIVADTARALDFYVDVLGVQVDAARAQLGFPGAWLNVGGGQQIHLLELPNPDAGSVRPEHAGRDRHTALQLHGLDAIEKRLQRDGRFEIFEVAEQVHFAVVDVRGQLDSG